MFVFNVLTRLYNLSGDFLFLFSTHNDLVQSEQRYWSKSISQLVHFWCNKYSPPSEVIQFGESFFMMIEISLYNVSDIHVPLLAVNGYNLLCWHRNFLLSIIYAIFSEVLFMEFLSFSIGFIVSNSFSQSSCNQYDFYSFLFPVYIFSMTLWSSSLIKKHFFEFHH